MDESTYSKASAVRDSHTFRSGFFIVITDCVRYLTDVARTVGLSLPSRFFSPTPTGFLEALHDENQASNITLSLTSNYATTIGRNTSAGRTKENNPRFKLQVLNGLVEIRANATRSEQDPYLYLLNESGVQIEEDDDDGGSRNALISRRLSAGTYYVVVASYNVGEVGDVSLSATGDVLRLAPILEPTPTAANTTPSISTNTSTQYLSQNGNWLNSAGQRYSSDSFAPVYEFTVEFQGSVTINLITPSAEIADPFLFLLAQPSSGLIEQNDDTNGYNSQITRVLAPGTYYLVPGTYRPGSTAPFALAVSGPVRNLQIPTLIRPALPTTAVTVPTSTLSVDPLRATVTGTWGSNSGRSSSAAGNLSYDLQITSVYPLSSVRLTTNSAVDTVLYLQNSNSFPLAYNDDIALSNLNSRIDHMLAPGTYRVIVGTYDSNRSGSFTLESTSSDATVGLRPR